MEFHIRTAPEVSFELPTSDTIVTGAVYSRGGQDLTNLSPGIPANGEVSVQLPYLQHEGPIQIDWTFVVGNTGYVTETHYYSVVTPLLSLKEVKEIIGSEATDKEAFEVEAAVRHIISAHTGQTFGKFVGARAVTGNGDSYLRLPQRLISYTTINGNSFLNSALSLRGGGWFLRFRNLGVPSIKADFHGWHENPYTHRAPIIAPPEARHFYSFILNAEYVIHGVWGWLHVPEPVKEAARLLVNDYACGDSMYRDRFLTSMTAADWRIQFHEGAFSNTGNVRANQLLAEFVLRRGWVVI